MWDPVDSAQKASPPESSLLLTPTAGEIQHRSDEDKDGNTRYITEINARELIMLGGRDGGAGPEGGAPNRARQPATTASKTSKQDANYEDFNADFPADDDLPF